MIVLKHSIVYKTFSYHYLTWLSPLCKVVIDSIINIHLQESKLRLEGKWLAPNHTAVKSSVWLVSWSHVLSTTPHRLYSNMPGWPCCIGHRNSRFGGKQWESTRITFFWDLWKTISHHSALIPNSTCSAPRNSFSTWHAGVDQVTGQIAGVVPMFSPCPGRGFSKWVGTGWWARDCQVSLIRGDSSL